MKKKKKGLAIGNSDFKEIIQENGYYVDKTKFIEDLLEDLSKVKLFTRPRRFGKTLNLSMLKYFFDVKNAEENRKLFEGLNISKSEYFEKQGEFPVISISFKNYNKNDWESGFKSIKSTISDIYAKFEYLMEHLNKRDLKKFEDMNSNTVTQDMLVGDIVRLHPEVVDTLLSHGMHCLGCPSSQQESLANACMVHGLDPEKIVTAVNLAIQTEKQ